MTKQKDKERVRQLASRQGGRVAAAQLARMGIAGSTVWVWQRDGYLERVLPGVYAVGHAAPNWEANLWAAVLYAGPGAMLSHRTAARWLQLIDHGSQAIHVSTARKVRSVPGVTVHARRRRLERVVHRGLPVTSIPLTMVDLASTTTDLRVINRALGQLDFRQRLDVDSLLGACASGARGSVLLRGALAAYDPRRKHANGPLEDAFYDLCARRGLPRPILNTYVHDVKVDAYWPAQGLAVELDGEENHSSPAQRRRDRLNDLRLRAHGLTVHRYDWDLVHKRPDEVVDDVIRALERLVRMRMRAEAL